MTTVADALPEIGKSRLRKEDEHLITGHTLWTDNLSLPGMLHLAILRSPMAHATIVSIDTTEAKARPGVVAVFTGQDFAETQGNVPCAWPVTPDMVNPGAPSLAVTQVNHVGEAVAVIAARSKAAAQDALKAIDVEYEQLPAVLDMEQAIADGATLVHPNTTSNRSYTWAFESGAAGTGGSDRRGAGQRRGDGQAPVHPAAADPGLHGAALHGRAADGGGHDGLVGDPDPAHPAHHAGADPGHPGAQDPRHRPGRRRRVRRQDPGDARRDHQRAGGAQAGQAGEVHRVALRVADDRAPRPRPDPGHHDHRQARRHRRPAWTCTCSPTWARTCAWSGRACRSWARSCTTRSTSSRPTGSSARASSPPRRPPTPTAVRAGRRRRSRSSGSWTSWPSNSAWTRWSCAARTGSSTRSSRSPRSSGSPTTAATTRPRPTRRSN